MERVLIIGATGYLGRKVLDALLLRDKPVRALVRATSSTVDLEEAGVDLVVGDLLDVDSLERAMQEVDAVVVTASGHRRRQPKDTGATDLAAARNIAAAAKKAGVRRVVVTGVVARQHASSVDHFHTKFLIEQCMRSANVPFVSVRAGGFLDQSEDFMLDAVRNGRLIWPSNTTVETTWILTDDLAEYLAAAVDLTDPPDIIEVGWSRPLSVGEIGDIASERMDRPLTRWLLPWWLVGNLLRFTGIFSHSARVNYSMLSFFHTGQFVIEDLKHHRAAFGGPPTPEDAIARWLSRGGLLPASES